jgi:hypothetical protein
MDDLTVSPLIRLSGSASLCTLSDQPMMTDMRFIRQPADRTSNTIDLNELLNMHPGNTYTFRITGNEGITQGIRDGDIAVVDRSARPQANDLVLWRNRRTFNLSRAGRLQPGTPTWGVLTAIVHPYRSADV